MRVTTASVAGIAAGLLLALPARAAGPDLHYRLWTTEEGLPTGSVRDVAQTPDGYLWIATLDGLVRFDGVRMHVLQRAEVPGMTSNRCLSLLADRQGALWVGTEEGGVLRLRGTEVRSFGVADGLPSPWVGVMEEDGNGRIWADTFQGTAVFDGERWAVVPASVLAPPEAARNLAVRRRDGGFSVVEDGRVVEYPPVGGRQPSDFWLDRGRARWLSIESGAAIRLHGGKAETVRWPSLPASKRLPQEWTRMWEGNDGRLWVLDGGHLHLRAGGRWQTMSPPVPSQILPRPRFLFEDREGTLWMGGDGGLVQATPTALRALVPPGPNTQTLVYTVAPDGPDRVWASTQGAALRWERGIFTPLDRSSWFPPSWISAMEPDLDGTLLAGGTQGVFRVRPGIGFEKIHDLSAEYHDFLRDRRGTLWIGSDHGLARLSPQGWRQVEGLPSNDVKVLLEDRSEDALWVGTYGGLVRLDASGMRTWRAADGLSSDRVRSLHQDDSGALWLGTYDGGLNRLAEGKLTAIHKRDGLFDEGVFTILDGGDGRLWMSSNRGIYAVGKRDLDAFVAGRIRRVSCRVWRSGDGMPSSECNGGRQPSGFRAADGTLWFPVQGGIAVVDPRAVGTNRHPPPVVIEEVVTDRRSLPAGAAIELQPEERRLEVRYTANSFVNPEGVRFRHRLIGFDDGWVEAGARRFAQYAKVPPGRYVLRVIAANSDGVWSPEGASLVLRFLPSWWETVWFRSGVALLVVGSLATGYRRRVSRLKKRRVEQDAFARRLLESQEAERKRIAGELHDGIGQTLVVIRNSALLGLRQGGDSLKQIAEISTAAGEGIEEVRKVAYGLRPYQLDRLGLKRALEAVVEQAAASSEIPITAAIADVDQVFRKDDEINVYRIVQEGLSNLVRHSGARHGTVDVGVRAAEVEIRIEDDGVGFDAAALSATGRGGLGLSGIAERARILGGRSAVRSVPGQGTVVTVTLPRRTSLS